MKSGLIAAAGLLVLFTFATSARPAPQQTKADENCAWLAQRIQEVKAVKVGMKRREVMKVLKEDKGGWEAYEVRASYRYEHPTCEYIKLDVAFKLAKSSKTDSNYLDDTVTKISHPYLDLVPNRARW